MEWRKDTLQEALKNTAYDDKLGFHRISVQSIEIFDENINDWRRPDNLYIKEKDGYNFISFNRSYEYINSLFEHMFDLEFFTLNAQKTRSISWYYGNPSQVNEKDLEKVKNSKIRINIRSTYEVNDRYYGRRDYHTDFSKIYDNPEELKEKSYLISEQRESLYIEPNLKDIKISGKYYCKSNNCSCEITKLYEYPNKEGLLFDIKLLSSETPTDKDIFTVKEANKSDKQIYILPYLEKSNHLDCFNESLDELVLQPYVTRDNNSKTYNAFWQPIENAARYIVSLYKTVELSYKEKVYHLKDYEVDRTDNFISIDGLVGDNFVFVIKAEDRSGKEIARSRGISIGEPKYW